MLKWPIKYIKRILQIYNMRAMVNHIDKMEDLDDLVHDYKKTSVCSVIVIVILTTTVIYIMNLYK